MKVIDFWQVDECYDKSVTVIGRFTTEAAARALVQKSNTMYRSVYRHTIMIFDSVEDFDNNTREKLRERALAKLTREEQIALGIK